MTSDAVAPGELWSAPLATGAVDATVVVPGSKSVTNRALVLAALATSPSRIEGALRARDTDDMMTGLQALGIGVNATGDLIAVAPQPLHGGSVHCGLSGTVSRFLTPVGTLADGDVHLDGEPALRARPIGPVLATLRRLGVMIDDDGRGTLPVTVYGRGGLAGGDATVDASRSSQFASALLLAAPRFTDGLLLRHEGGPMPSAPYLALTTQMLRAAGARVHDDVPGRWHVEPGPLHGRTTVVEPDLTNAAPFLAAALLTGGRVTVPRWPARTVQAGDALRGLLTDAGADVRQTPQGLTVRGTGSVRGIDADLTDAGELAPTLAAVAAVADSPSVLSGIGHLRHHETDRLAALTRELTALGAEVTEEPAALRIRPRPLHAGVWETYEDHRLATTGALLGLVVPGLRVRDIATTAKTMPGFVELWTQMLTDGAA